MKELSARTVNSSSYRYGFNGKEKDEDGEWSDVTHLDFGARIYNPGIGRWLSLDPLMKKYPSESAYNFVGNSPIIFIDPDGRDLILRILKMGGDQPQILNDISNILDHTLGKDGYLLENLGDNRFNVVLIENFSPEMHHQEQARKHFKTVIDDKQNTNLSIVGNSDYVTVDEWNSSSVDVGDIIQFPNHKGVNNDRGTKAGKIVHVVIEQFILQGQETDNWDFKPAHKKALEAEAEVDGVERLSDKKLWVKGDDKTFENVIWIDTKYECSDCSTTTERTQVRDPRTKKDLPTIKITYPNE